LLVPVLERIHAVMVPEGQMLALFHPPAECLHRGRRRRASTVIT